MATRTLTLTQRCPLGPVTGSVYQHCTHLLPLSQITTSRALRHCCLFCLGSSLKRLRAAFLLVALGSIHSRGPRSPWLLATSLRLASACTAASPAPSHQDLGECTGPPPHLKTPINHLRVTLCPLTHYTGAEGWDLSAFGRDWQGPCSVTTVPRLLQICHSL